MADDNYRQLRQRFDSNDPFMSHGHRIAKPRRGWRMKQIPVWAHNDKAIQEFVLRSFPKLKTDKVQRSRAARWIRVIHLYVRMGWTAGQVAEELHENVNTIRCLLKAILRVSVGRRADATGMLGAPKGRPKKHDPIQEPLRDLNADHSKVGAGTLL